MAKPRLTDNDLYKVATYLARPETGTEIHAELPKEHRLKFESEYKQATGKNLAAENKQGPYYVWSEGTNKWARELRIYFKRVPPEPPIIKNLYTDQGKWYARRESYRINHSALVMQLFECGFLLGKNENNTKRIRKFMKNRFPAK